MRQSLPLTAALAALFLTGCAPAQVEVTAEIEVQDPETGETRSRPLSNLQVSLLPYDRDLIFDSLAALAPTPEPEIPADVLEAQAVIAAAQREWLSLENRWNVLRDTLQTLNRTLEGLPPQGAQYRLLHSDWVALDARLEGIERDKDRAFNNFQNLQTASTEREQEVRIQREEWADDAFSEVVTIFRERVRSSGLTMAVDTTDAQGAAGFDAKPGQYWVHARFAELFTELYWNIPVTVERGEPIRVQLTRANAQERPRL